VRCGVGVSPWYSNQSGVGNLFVMMMFIDRTSDNVIRARSTIVFRRSHGSHRDDSARRASRMCARNIMERPILLAASCEPHQTKGDT
jgi:hypothetical protein